MGITNFVLGAKIFRDWQLRRQEKVTSAPGMGHNVSFTFSISTIATKLFNVCPWTGIYKISIKNAKMPTWLSISNDYLLARGVRKIYMCYVHLSAVNTKPTANLQPVMHKWQGRIILGWTYSFRWRQASLDATRMYESAAKLAFTPLLTSKLLSVP